METHHSDEKIRTWAKKYKIPLTENGKRKTKEQLAKNIYDHEKQMHADYLVTKDLLKDY